MTTNLESRLSAFSPAILSLFRIVFGLLFAAHGASKVLAWPIDYGSGAFPIGSWPSWWAGLIELVAGLLIMVGLFTRAAAFIAAGQMAVAYFWQHQPHGLWPIDPTQNPMGQPMGGGEPAVLYCFAFLLLVFTGGGAYAVDALRARNRATTTADR